MSLISSTNLNTSNTIIYNNPDTNENKQHLKSLFNVNRNQ